MNFRTATCRQGPWDGYRFLLVTKRHTRSFELIERNSITGEPIVLGTYVGSGDNWIWVQQHSHTHSEPHLHKRVSRCEPQRDGFVK